MQCSIGTSVRTQFAPSRSLVYSHERHELSGVHICSHTFPTLPVDVHKGAFLVPEAHKAYLSWFVNFRRIQGADTHDYFHLRYKQHARYAITSTLQSQRYCQRSLLGCQYYSLFKARFERVVCVTNTRNEHDSSRWLICILMSSTG